MSGFLQDLRHALRSLLGRPTFTLMVLITLTLGIGATSAIFSVVNAVLLSPLPYPEADRLTVLWGTLPDAGKDRSPTSLPDFFDWQEQNTVFEEMATFGGWDYIVDSGDRPLQLRGGLVSHELFEVLRVQPSRGRTPTLEEDRPGGDKVVLLSDGLWHRLYGGDPEILGQTLRIDDNEHQIIGIMPASFEFPEGAELWVPLALDRDSYPRRLHFRDVVGRLAPGVTVEQAQEEMSRIAKWQEEEYPSSNVGRGVRLVALVEELVGDVRPALMMLLGAALVVLFIACCNVAGLLLVRASARRNEVAVRTALGAGGWRLLRGFFAESLLLVVAGAALGLLAARFGVAALMALHPGDLPRIGSDGGGGLLNGDVVLFTVGLAIVTVAVFTLLPAFQLRRAESLGSALREAGGRGGVSRAGRRFQAALVVAQVALALTLTVSAVLMLRSFSALTHVDPGFRTQGLLTARISLPPARYPDNPRTSSFFQQLEARVAALPGVTEVGSTWSVPLTWLKGTVPFVVEGAPPPEPGLEPRTSLQPVTPGFFGAMGLPLIEGRVLDAADDMRGRPVVVVNRRMAESQWPGDEAIGKRIGLNVNFGPIGMIEERFFEVVGVVGDVRRNGLAESAVPETYVPLPQTTWRLMTLLVATGGEPMALADEVSEQVWALDSKLPVSDLRPIGAFISDAVARPRFNMALLGLFAGVALVLAVVGVYGVIAYSAGRRHREIGLRMALGAEPGDVLRLVVRQGLLLTALGVVAGLALSLAAGRFIEGMLFGVEVSDPLTLGGAALALAAVSLLASYLPARRAARIEPAVALRRESAAPGGR